MEKISNSYPILFEGNADIEISVTKEGKKISCAKKLVSLTGYGIKVQSEILKTELHKIIREIMQEFNNIKD